MPVSKSTSSIYENAKRFKNTVDNYTNNRNEDSIKKGMYAGSVNPESYLEQFKKSRANRQKKGSPWSYPSRKALEDTIMSYFEFCIDKRIPVTVAGLCAWLGISVATLGNWKRNQDTQPYFDIADSTVSFIHAMTEQGAVEGNIPSSVYQFLSKNYHGLKDQMDYFVTPQENMTALEAKSIVDKLPDMEKNDE